MDKIKGKFWIAILRTSYMYMHSASNNQARICLTECQPLIAVVGKENILGQIPSSIVFDRERPGWWWASIDVTEVFQSFFPRLYVHHTSSATPSTPL
jgi:hypothetical protein